MNADKVNQWLSLLTNIGVLIGIGLLVFEINQNADLMRAEMHAMRAEAKATRQMEMANSGEMVRVMSAANAAGFPRNPEALDALTPEDRLRYASFVAGLTETVQNWHYQCQQDLLDEELCRASYEPMAKGLLVSAHAMGADFTTNRPSFVSDLRRLAKDAGLPVPNEDGSW